MCMAHGYETRFFNVQPGPCGGSEAQSHEKCSYRFAIYLRDSCRTKADSLIKTDITQVC